MRKKRYLFGQIFFQYRHNGDSFLFSLVKYNAALHKKEITKQPNQQIHCHIKNINKNSAKIIIQKYRLLLFLNFL